MKKLLAMMFVATLILSAVAMTPTSTQAGGRVQVTPFDIGNKCC